MEYFELTCSQPLSQYRFVGPVVKVSASRAADPGFDSRGDFSGSSHTSDIYTGTPVAGEVPFRAFSFCPARANWDFYNTILAVSFRPVNQCHLALCQCSCIRFALFFFFFFTVSFLTD